MLLIRKSCKMCNAGVPPETGLGNTALADTLFSTFLLFPSFLLKIDAFPMQYEI